MPTSPGQTGLIHVDFGIVSIRLGGGSRPHELVEALPEGRDGRVFFGHAEHFFELAVENV